MTEPDNHLCVIGNRPHPAEAGHLCALDNCARPTHNSLICNQHTWELDRHLLNTNSLFDELDTTLARASKSTAHTERVQGKSETPVVFHQAASEAIAALTDALIGYCEDLTRTIATNPRHAAQTIQEALTGLGKHGDLPKACDELLDAYSRGVAAIDAPVNRTVIPVGPCPERLVDGTHCAGTINAFIPADDRPARMSCDNNTEHWWSSIQWLRAGERIRDLIDKRKKEAEEAAKVNA